MKEEREPRSILTEEEATFKKKRVGRFSDWRGSCEKQRGAGEELRDILSVGD
jgi:hypothetical protein